MAAGDAADRVHAGLNGPTFSDNDGNAATRGRAILACSSVRMGFPSACAIAIVQQLLQLGVLRSEFVQSSDRSFRKPIEPLVCEASFGSSTRNKR